MARKPVKRGGVRSPVHSTPAYADFVARLASNTRRLRAERGWTQELAAERCAEMDVTGYRAVENRRAHPTAATLVRLALGFEVDVLALLAPALPPKPRRQGRPAKPWPVEAIRAARGLSLGAAPTDAVEAESADEPRVTTMPSTSRLQKIEVALPTERGVDLRSFVLALLAANAGLTSREVIEVARVAGHKHASANAIHLILHDLCRRGHVIREGDRGAYVFRLKRAS